MEAPGIDPIIDRAGRPIAVLRGGARGLEIVVTGTATTDAIVAAVTGRLAEAPGFFRGSDVRIRVEDGPLAPGCLSQLDDIAGRFELRIVEVGSPKRESAVPQPALAAGSAPAPATQEPLPLGEARASERPAEEPAVAPAVPPDLELALRALAQEPDIEIIHDPEPPEPETRIVVGPVRSGVVLEHRGHLFVFGDVNPGAEIRAEGNIVVLGRLRGTAHAGIESPARLANPGAPRRDAAFILALRLTPQQLRIGRTVARASDTDKPDTFPEIAHVVGGTIVVERYLGRLPNGLAASI